VIVSRPINVSSTYIAVFRSLVLVLAQSRRGDEHPGRIIL